MQELRKGVHVDNFRRRDNGARRALGPGGRGLAQDLLRSCDVAHGGELREYHDREGELGINDDGAKQFN